MKEMGIELTCFNFYHNRAFTSDKRKQSCLTMALKTLGGREVERMEERRGVETLSFLIFNILYMK